MERNHTNQDVTWFLDLKDKGQLDLDPPYQRRSVWSPRDKRYFIDTVLNNYPAPPIFLHKELDDEGRPTYHVVDGKQRLQTIIEFRQNRLRLAPDFHDTRLQKKCWNDLDQGTRKRFFNYVLSVEMLPDVNDATIKSIFDRINRNSRKLVPQEMRHAKYEGWFISFVEREADKTIWRDFGVSTTARVKRMADVQFVSELCAVVLKRRIFGFDQDHLDTIYAEYEDLLEVGDFVEEAFVSEVERIKGYIADVLSSEADVLQYLRVQSHFYTLWGYLHLEHEHGLQPAKFGARYREFLAMVSLVMSTEETQEIPEMAEMEEKQRQAIVNYAKSVRGASTDYAPRARRHAGLRHVMGAEPGAKHEDS